MKYEIWAKLWKYSLGIVFKVQLKLHNEEVPNIWLKSTLG